MKIRVHAQSICLYEIQSGLARFSEPRRRLRKVRNTLPGYFNAYLGSVVMGQQTALGPAPWYFLQSYVTSVRPMLVAELAI